jgi:glycine cleavage system H protein
MAEEIRFTKEHEWIIMRKEEGEKQDSGFAIIGISDFAQKELGDIVSLELPKVGSKFKQMQAMAIIDSVKASSDVYCALSGDVVEVNEDLLQHPEWINQSPYELGWIVKLRPSSDVKEELNNSMTKEEYEKFVGEL